MTGHERDYIVEVQDLIVRFGKHTAVDGLSFDIGRGEVFGFLGPNGAGKTTTIRSITTLQRPTSGTIVIDGYDTSSDYLEARKRMGIAQQHISLDKDLTVEQNIIHHALLHKIPRSDIGSRISYVSELLGLDEFMDHKVENLSGGWKRKVSIVCAIIHQPKLLLLDEPTAGLDTRSRHLLWDLVRDLRNQGTTILLTTHYIEEAESLCDHIAIINHGRMVAMGSIDEIRDIVGRIAVDYTDGGRRVVRYFSTRADAKEYSESLDGDALFNIRKTTLEDVFLELTGEDRGLSL